MIKIDLNGIKLAIQDSARTLPEFRRSEHDYYALIESGVGSTLEDIDRHLETSLGLIGSEDLEAQHTAIQNLRILFNKILERDYSPGSLAFCCLIDSIDGERWTDYTPQGIEAMSDLLRSREVVPGEALIIWQKVKKKSTQSLTPTITSAFLTENPII